MAGDQDNSGRGWPQLALDFRWDEAADMAAYVPGANGEPVAAIRRAVVEPSQSIHLHGARGTGKSHLLQAACGLATDAATTAVYLPIDQMRDWSAEVLDGLENIRVVAVDDVDVIAGQQRWEEALFHLFNRLRDTGGVMLTAASAPPHEIGLSLPDLASRLQWGLVYRLRPLDDEGRAEALRRRATRRGLALPPESARYLLSRYPRDTRALLALLEELDVASLQAGRRLTVPFIREVLGSGR